MTGWVRSSHCAAGDCIEILQADDGSIWLRAPAVHLAKLGRAEWDAFIAGVKDGDFDQLAGDTP